VQIINPQVACSDNGKPYGKPGVDWTDPVTSGL